MTNREWLLWKLIDVGTDILPSYLDKKWFCDYFCPDRYNCEMDCGIEICCINMSAWLKQEYKEDD